ncbi:tryptophan 7-halogenase [Streptomyces sp. MZ04]|uniref:NAD(P)/FAD-dependent oxidoreductase n=1 Tax=Streptomyces sp. MZ04 TaxID=2559236 RepID=UPI00107E64EC|nr:tryptophan 7-halogenase [Streptomyces sp. MZ04]TGB15145.1 FAD-dependent oxidoreductase [Streptomyces sp. MZ04]
MPDRDDAYDVIILGSGIAGSILGAVLARNGAKVMLVDAGVHPRFAVGESSIPRTLNMFRIIAERYDVPELELFCSFDKAIKEIAPTMGRKLHFGFMMHEEGKEPDPAHTTQLGTHIPDLHTSHLFRQDTDSYLFHLAVKYGCVARQAYRVQNVDFGEHEVTISGQDGTRFRTRYLVDASGFRSPVAEQLGLRAGPDALKHHARSLFTHMIDVRPTDECLKMPKEERPPLPWVMGTMHHVFERGWFWVIPFNNDPGSINPLVSVGLTFDERRYPKPDDITPAEEFARHVSRFPVLERIFADAKTVRPWVSTGRFQYTSTQTVGHRWCMMSHAAGFIDPLYSRGLSNTGEVIDAVAWRLLRALKDDDFSEERFAYVERLQQSLVRYNDNLVNCSFISWSDWDLWNAVYRVWAASQMPASMRLSRAVERFRISRDEQVFTDLEDEEFVGSPFPNKAYDELFFEMVRLCDAVDHGELRSGDAGAQLMRAVRSSPAVLPMQGLDDPESRFVAKTRESFLGLARWLAAEGPQDMRYLVDNPRIKAALASRPTA